MRALAEKTKTIRQARSPRATAPARSYRGQIEGVSSILHAQRSMGNRAVQQLLQAHAEGSRGDFASPETGRIVQDSSRIPLGTSMGRSMLPGLKVGARADEYEREADQIANHAMSMARPERSMWGRTGSSAALQDPEVRIERSSDFGKPLDPGTNEEMRSRIGADFSGVRVHTDELATRVNERLGTRAFTYGSDIFFNRGEYDPHSFGGRRVLAHELAHVVQQARMGDSAQRKMIQCTGIGEILEEFFSPFSSETLWVMPESDNYTRIVRRWQPVIDAVNRAKASLAADCAGWSAGHRTTPSWKPGKTDPPVTDPNAHREFVPSPPGTDPATCKRAFEIYVATKLTIFPVQTFELYTCSIGSFNIYATVDSIDCTAKTARMNIWMYNAMSRKSFGRFASHPLFAASGMEKQYMWWNWKENHAWVPAAAPGGGSGGSGGWG